MGVFAWIGKAIGVVGKVGAKVVNSGILGSATKGIGTKADGTKKSTLGTLIDGLTKGGSKSKILNALGNLSGVPLLTKLIPGFDGFIKNGFKFSCLGSQAVSQKDVQSRLTELEQKTAGVDLSNPNALNNFRNDLEGTKGYFQGEIGKLKSACSKKNTQIIIDAYQNVINSLPAVESSLAQTTNTEMQFNAQQELGINKIASELAQTTSQTLAQATQQVKQGIFGGSIFIDEQGNITWSASAGNEPQPNYGQLAMIAGGAFLLYKLIKK